MPIRTLAKKAAMLLAAFLLVLIFASCGERNTAQSGDIIAFVTDGGIGIYNLDGGGITHPVSGENIYGLVFSPDGKYLAYKVSSDLFCLDISAGKSALAAVNADAICFKDGLLFAVSAVNGVTGYDMQTGESTQIIKKPEEGYVSSVIFSPDGSRMLYTVCTEDVGKTITLFVNVTIPGSDDVDSFRVNTVTGQTGRRILPVCWTPDASAVLVKYSFSDSAKITFNIFPVIEGSFAPLKGKTLSASRDERLILSADGLFAAVPAYKNSDDAYATLALINLTSQSYSYIPSGDAGFSGIALSRDASMTAYASGEYSETSETLGIFIYSNNKTLKICGGDGISYMCPVFSGDARKLYFIGISQDECYFYSAKTNTAGCEKLFSGVCAPDGVYTRSWYDMFAVYEQQK